MSILLFLFWHQSSKHRTPKHKMDTLLLCWNEDKWWIYGIFFPQSQMWLPQCTATVYKLFDDFSTHYTNSSAFLASANIPLPPSISAGGKAWNFGKDTFWNFLLWVKFTSRDDVAIATQAIMQAFQKRGKFLGQFIHKCKNLDDFKSK